MCGYFPLLLFSFSINLSASECQSILANGSSGWEPISHQDSKGGLSGMGVEVAKQVFLQLDVELTFEK